MKILETERLILRTWEEADIESMAVIDSDEKVCQFLPYIGTLETTRANIQRFIEHYKTKGFSLCAVELKATHEMIGWVGLLEPSFEAHFTPAIEIGWRLASKYWNQGYATEGAKAVLHDAFTRFGLQKVVSFTTENNLASRRVMEKIGLRHDVKDDFDHPKLAPEHPLKRHVLYRLSQADYFKQYQDKVTDFSEKIKTAYDNIAPIWYEKRDWYIEKPSVDELIKQLHSNAAILDVGCGSGKPLAAYLINQGFDVYGLDISSKQIEYAKKVIPEQKLFVADINHFSTTMQFDAIICWFALFHIHVSRHAAVLKKLHSLLKPGGLLLITFADTSIEVDVPFKQIDEYTIESEMFGEDFYHSGQPAEENSALVKQAGFNILSDKIDQPGNQVILAKKMNGS